MTNEKNNVAYNGDEVKTKRKKNSTWGTIGRFAGGLLTVAGIFLRIRKSGDSNKS